MSAPLPVVRAVMLERARTRLEAQHRQAVGMGGSKVRPRLHELVTLCSVHNAAAEADLQTKALACGWKVRGWVTDCALVPVFYAPELSWFRLELGGARARISDLEAERMMRDVYEDDYDEMVRAAA